MTISVVIPTYNRAQLLRPTLRAVLGQTHAAEEVIVVDDGSTDDTQAVLRDFGAPTRVLRIANSGELAARNAGLRAARGDLVAFCDSDDLWRPGFLAAMQALWRAEPRTVAAYADFAVVRNDAWSATGKFAEAPAGYWAGLRAVGPQLAVFDQPIIERLIAFQPFFPSCMAVRRDAFLALGGWDEGISRTVGHDFATALRMAEHAPFGVVSRPLVGIRKHDGNFSADVQKMNLGDSLVLEYVLASRPSLAPHAALIRQSIATRRRAALDTAFTRGDFAAVQAIYAQLPRERRSLHVQVKARVAALPVGVRDAVSQALLRIGSAGTALRRA